MDGASQASSSTFRVSDYIFCGFTSSAFLSLPFDVSNEDTFLLFRLEGKRLWPRYTGGSGELRNSGAHRTARNVLTISPPPA